MSLRNERQRERRCPGRRRPGEPGMDSLLRRVAVLSASSSKSVNRVAVEEGDASRCVEVKESDMQQT